jgi:hypothetical protein
MSEAAHVEAIAGDSWCHPHMLPEFVYGSHLELIPRAQHGECPRLVNQVDETMSRDGRGDHLATNADPLAVKNATASLWISYCPQGAVTNEVNPTLVEQGRWDFRKSTCRFPGDM